MKRWIVAAALLAVVAGSVALARRDGGPREWVRQLGSSRDRVSAYERLSDSADPAVRAALLEGLGTSPEVRVRASCARILGHAGPQGKAEVAAALERRLDDADADVRLQAAIALQSLLEVAELRAILDDGSRSIAARASLARGLTQNGACDFSHYLAGWLSARKQVPELRVQAATLLGEICDRSTQILLRERAADPTEPLRLRARCWKSYGMVMRVRGFERLRAVAADRAQPYLIREAAVYGMRGRRALPTLASYLSDLQQPTSMRVAALHALGWVHSPRAMSLRLAALRDPSTTVRLEAAQGLGCSPGAVVRAALRAAVVVETDESVLRALRHTLSALERKPG